MEMELMRLGVSIPRNPNESAQAHINRLLSNAPPEAAWEMKQQGAPTRSPPCECVECTQQFKTAESQKSLPSMYTRSISWKDAQRKCDAWVEEIASSHAYLQDAVKKHGNTIINRWTKRSVAKRAILMKRAFPGIATKKHEILEKTYVERLHEAREARDFYLVSYITLDQMTTQPMRFLSLLHARMHYTPEQWVAWDAMQLVVGWITGKLAIEYCDNVSVVFHGSKYGQVVRWRGHQAHSWTTIGYPKAQLVLESQVVVMRTVRRVVEQILVGVEIHSLSSKWDNLVQSGFRTARDEGTWAVPSNQGYLWPPTCEGGAMQELCQSRLALAQDELWLLQTDPAYMQQMIAATRSTKLSAQHIKYGGRMETRVCQAAIMYPFRRVNEWHDVVADCQVLMAEQLKHFDSIRLGQALPSDYEKAVGCLEIKITKILVDRTEDLKVAMEEASSFEHYFTYVQGAGKFLFFSKLNTGQDTSEMFSTDPLFWCLFQMTRDPECAQTMDSAILFAFFDDMVARDPSSAGRIDSQLLHQLSDLAALWELLRTVRLQRPLARRMTIKEALSVRAGGFWEEMRAHEKVDKNDEGEVYANELTSTQSTISQLMAAKVPTGRRDEKWLRQSEESHAALTKLWTEFRGSRVSALRAAGISEEHIDACMANTSFDKSATYQETLRAERVKVMTRFRNIPEPLVEDRVSQWSTLAPTQHNARDFPTQASTKVKTHATGTTNGDHISEAPIEAPKAAPPVIMLKSESLQIFRCMFPSPEDDNEPSRSMIDWRKFVLAMADAGFSSRQNTGSAVTFDNERGRIVFHKPHPVAKIDFRVLMRMGKRLNRWFGLGRESFEAI